MAQTDWMAPVGFAYLSPSVYEVYDKGGFTSLRQSKIVVTLPEWFTKGGPRKAALSREDAERLITLYEIEDRYVDRMARLDEILDRALKEKKPIPLDDLKDAARKFAEMADDVDEWRENAFFAIFDKVVEAGLKKTPRDKPARESAMILEITPDGTNKITKALTRRN
jgi:alkanesulfonate monooxygenase SsuD/methylene tetrahydromethanopterin reductase-like flavin-dependent oxidoreductase (luciferase family)